MLRRCRGPANAKGMTIAELTTTLAIATVLAGTAAPGMSRLITTNQADVAIEQMRSAVQFARQAAITQRMTVTLCPGSGATCGRRDSWHEGALTFVDRNENSQRDSGEPLMHRIAPLPTGYRLRWSSFRNRKSLSMKPTGLTDWQNGNMLLCPPDGDAKQARMLIVSAHGRVRLARDSDGDGIVERANGNPVTC